MLALASAPVGAAPSRPIPGDALRTYVAARGAEAVGDQARAAQLFASLSAADPADLTLAQRAIEGAIQAGNMPLALQVARRLRDADLSIDARLLLIADDLRSGRTNNALLRLQAKGATPDLSFLDPLVRAWIFAERGDGGQAIASLDRIAPNGPLGSFLPEQRALLLIRVRQTAEADADARRAIAAAGGREQRVRLALAEGFRAAGDKPRAMAMLDGAGSSLGRARARVAAGQIVTAPVASTSAAFAEVLLGIAITVNRDDSQEVPIAFTQVARYLAPENGEAAIVLGLLLDQDERREEALRTYAAVRPDDLLLAQALDARVRTLVRSKRETEALAIARQAANARGADSGDYSRLGDVLEGMGRHAEAGDAYLRAIALLPPTGPGSSDNWTTYLLAASALEEAGRWPEARSTIERALTFAPDQPLLLNFLGYAKLTHGEDIEAAEAMIRKASALRPSDASITDSLGWALFKRGKLDEAITTLEKAAAGDPAQSEIGEHLGDALYTAGRHYEARFAWRAALVTAENTQAKRIGAKLEQGLVPATAAP